MIGTLITLMNANTAPVGGNPSELFRLTLEGTGEPADTVYLCAHGFKRGDFPPATPGVFKQVSNNVALRTQIDPQTYYSDGSIEHALLAIEGPSLAIGALLELKFIRNEAHGSPGGALSLPTLLAGRPMLCCVTPVGGSEWQYDLAANLPTVFRRNGPLAIEGRRAVVIPSDSMGLSGASPPRNSDGGRAIMDVMATKDLQCHIHFSANNDSSNYPSAGFKNANFSTRALIDGVVVASHAARVVTRYTRMPIMGGRRPGGAVSWNSFWMRPDSDYLASAGFCSKYNRSNPLTAPVYAAVDYSAAMARPTWNDGAYPIPNTGDTRNLNTYWQTGGDHPNLSIVAAEDAAWLQGSDKRPQQYAQDVVQTFCTNPIHFWDRTNGNWIDRTVRNTHTYYTNTDWFDISQGPNFYNDPPGPFPREGVWAPSSSHIPGVLGTVYMLRGLHSHLDTISALASSMLSEISASPPNFTTNENINIMNVGQIRTTAWVMRSLMDAVRYLPASDSLRSYFASAVQSNMTWYDVRRPGWNTAQGELWHTFTGVIGQGFYATHQAWYLYTVLRMMHLRGEHTEAAPFMTDLVRLFSVALAQTGDGFPQARMDMFWKIWPNNDGQNPYTTWAAFKAAHAAHGLTQEGGVNYQDDYTRTTARAMHKGYQSLFPSNADNNNAVAVIAAMGLAAHTAGALALDPRQNV